MALALRDCYLLDAVVNNVVVHQSGEYTLDVTYQHFS